MGCKAYLERLINLSLVNLTFRTTMKHETITSKDFQRVFWLNDNQDFCCSSLDAQHQVDYVSSWIARTTELNTESTKAIKLEHIFTILTHLTIARMGGFSTMLDSYKNKKIKTS